MALGGSAYAAATINSQKVVDNSLTGADIRGRDASKGKPFTEGTLTGQDVRGSAGAPGRPAVDGSLTGADIANQSLTGADVAGKSLTGAQIADGSLTGANIFGKSITAVNIADGTLTGSQIADNALTGAKIDESTLGQVPDASHASDAGTVGGFAPGALGSFVRTGSQPSASCYSRNNNLECAAVYVTVPAGRSYDAVVWSAIAATGASSNTTQFPFDYCSFVRRSTDPVDPQSSGHCITPSRDFEDGITFPPGHSESGATFGSTASLGLHLGPGKWVFGTLTRAFDAGSLLSDPSNRVHTTVLLTDAQGPALATGPSSGCAGTSVASSSSSSSSGASSSSSGASGSSSGGTSSGSSGQTSSSSGTSSAPDPCSG